MCVKNHYTVLLVLMKELKIMVPVTGQLQYMAEQSPIW